MKALHTLVAIGSLIVVGASAVSAQVQITDRAQLGPSATLSWEGHPSSNPFTMATGVAGVDMTVTGRGVNLPWYTPCQAGACWNGGFSDNDWLLFGYGAQSYDLTFSGLINGFATQAWFNNTTTDGHRMQLTAWNGLTQVAQYSVFTGGGGGPNENQASVLGIGGASFDRLEILAIAPPNESTEFALNQVTFMGATVVPEPSTYALMGVGLIALGVIARRRKTSIW